MAKYLIIVESPGKVSKIQSFLSSSFDTIASVGHISDLSKKKLGVDIKDNFKTTYEVLDDKKDVVKNILTKAKKADIVYLATDADREGEQISALIKSLLPKDVKTKRITYNSITKDAVLKAIDNPRDIDVHLVDAAECRRVLDRLVGFKCSWTVTQATGGKSAGRVQSATLRFLADRENEIKKFVPQKYWEITAELLTSKKEKIIASLKVPEKLLVNTEKMAKEICDIIKKGPVKVSKFEKKEVNLKPYAPFTTSVLQQSASTYLGCSPDKTMKLAQGLYESIGAITYMRTDSTMIVAEVITEMRDKISSKYGDKYLPSKSIFYSAGKNAQEAHEACRQTHVDWETVNHEGSDLYKMIWKRSIASQMSDAKYLRSSAEFSCNKYILGANGSKCLFDGWKKCWDFGSNEDVYLPELSEGEILDVIDIKMEAKETEPPPRFSEASTIKRMEQLGIGRPATYAATLKTLKDRTYIDTKKKAIVVTDLGLKVIEFLVASNFCFVNLDFTCKMEDKLDLIAENKASKLDVLTEFWSILKKDLENAKTVKGEQSKTNYKCPKCGGNLLNKHGKFGNFMSCENYSNKEKKCEYVANIGENGEPVEKVKKIYEESEEFKCPHCKEFLIIRESKFGKYLACKNFKDDACKGFYNFSTGVKSDSSKKKKFKYFKKKKNTEGDE
jgi:DNA topoisomerase-1